MHAQRLLLSCAVGAAAGDYAGYGVGGETVGELGQRHTQLLYADRTAANVAMEMGVGVFGDVGMGRRTGFVFGDAATILHHMHKTFLQEERQRAGNGGAVHGVELNLHFLGSHRPPVARQGSEYHDAQGRGSDSMLPQPCRILFMRWIHTY